MPIRGHQPLIDLSTVLDFQCHTPASTSIRENDMAILHIEGRSLKYKVIPNLLSKNIPPCIHIYIVCMINLFIVSTMHKKNVYISNSANPISINSDIYNQLSSYQKIPLLKVPHLQCPHSTCPQWKNLKNIQPQPGEQNKYLLNRSSIHYAHIK